MGWECEVEVTAMSLREENGWLAIAQSRQRATQTNLRERLYGCDVLALRILHFTTLLKLYD